MSPFWLWLPRCYPPAEPLDRLRRPGRAGKDQRGPARCIESGRCDVTATLAIAEAETTSRTVRFGLPGVVPLRGRATAPAAEEYPAAGQHTKNHVEAPVAEAC